METGEALDQAADSVSESSNAGGAGDGQAIDANEDSTQGQGNDLGVKEVPPELKEKEKELVRGFHAKSQAFAEEKRVLNERLAAAERDAAAFNNLIKQDWLKEAAEKEKALRTGRATELSQEAFESIKNDPNAFSKFMNEHDQRLLSSIKSQLAPELDKLNKSQGDFAAEKALDAAARQYGKDFVEAKESGALDNYLKEYDPATGYKLYCQDHGKVAGKAEVKPAALKNGVVEKNGMSQARGGPVIKIKGGLNEMLDRAFEQARQGKLKETRFEKE